MKKFKITKIQENSIAEELGITAGDFLISINGQPIVDIIDYLYLTSDEEIELLIENHVNNEQTIFEIEKDFDDEIGLSFENPLLDDAKRCSNQCVFCFVDQLPKGMRETLYFKDDDSRLSFMQGNFVTLTNVSYEQLDRIVKYHISPINISVHTSNPKLRVEILNNRFAGDILDKMRILASGNITMNAQIVLMPGINDQEHLDRTIEDLAMLYPQVQSVAIVPVGISKHREGLFQLNPFTKESSYQSIVQIENIQSKMLKKLGTRFAFLSDEFYVNAEYPLPEYDTYEGFVQLEDGIGLMRKFQTDIINSMVTNKLNGKYLMVTGLLAEKYLKELVEDIVYHNKNLSIDVKAIRNDFFGEKITVSGLITAQDIIDQLEDVSIYDALLLPDVMFKADEDVFLDDMNIGEISEKIKAKIIKVPVEGKLFLQILEEMSR
ncbi:MAG: DUF512 domain-containing protein [Clostridiales bacterium]|nr:DUF512 domain-containing protein [Clostridiales bacterium]